MARFQSFDRATRPEQGPPRLAALRREMRRAGLDAFLVPRADRHQGEWVAPADQRLAWLTGFTGSAGFCAVTARAAGLFVDGRYRLQARQEVDLAHFTPLDWPRTALADWLKQALPQGGRLGFDPWLHVQDEIDRLTAALEGSGIVPVESDNLIDRIWTDRPPPPAGPIRIHPESLAGESAADKRRRLGRELDAKGAQSAVLTLPDSICWLLNIRGGDLPHMPVVLGFAVLHAGGAVDLFVDPERADDEVRAHLGQEVALHPAADFAKALAALPGPVLVDPATAPIAVSRILSRAGRQVIAAPDPCILPKARKNPVEIAGTRAAHRRDAVAMARFLHWLDAQGSALGTRQGALTEIDVVERLEEFRRDTGRLVDISFETICGAGPNGAIVHYRVSRDTNRALAAGELLLVDSGGQYADGTTDITRTIALGEPPAQARRDFTLVLKGMIAIARARWPRGLAGRDLDALARIALWRAGCDYDHGTGHGVGVFLGVHEGPQRISRASEVALEPGMILSDEPGLYREGRYGIRIENLLVVTEAPPLEGAEDRPMLAFETLTLAPIDRALIDPALLDAEERAWLDAYHARVVTEIAPHCPPRTAAWLERVCAPI